MSQTASDRLATLRRHLDGGGGGGSGGGSGGAAAAPAPTAAATSTTTTTAPLAGGGPGTLTLLDSRTGRKYEVPILDGGVIRATDLKQIKAGGDGVGLRTYDPGYMNTAACRSAISYIDGEKGILRYRGYPIEHLAEAATFPEVAHLVIYGRLPTGRELGGWEDALARHSALPAPVLAAVDALPHDAHPMGTVLTALCALSTCHPEQNPALAGEGVYGDVAVQDKQIARLVGKMPAIAALAYHRASGRKAAPPNQRLGYAENFLYMLDAGAAPGYRPHPALARALDIMFTLHAEHEMNCSTAAARHLASSGVDVYTAVAGAVGALYGPLHGGANEAVLRMLQRIGSVEAIPAFLAGVKAKKEKLFGFGHRVYKNFDPRAAIIRRVADEVFAIQGSDPLIAVATALADAARADPYFQERSLYPNVDFYSGLVYRSLGFPPAFFTVLFAVPRVVGYLAHWREQLADPDTRIVRPQQVYVGEWLRPAVEAIGERAEPPAASAALPFGKGGKALAPVFGEVPPSNAYRRRVAGTNWA